MFVTFWNVGASASTQLPMDFGDVSTHLAADWLPLLPVSISSSFMGWPPYLLKADPTHGLLTQENVGKTERQWKSVLSWMLGVAGTRHVLGYEKYRWVAPLSAFYPNAKQPVSVKWHPQFPPGTLIAKRRKGKGSRLMPDYVAIRPTTSQSEEWAIVESKGTNKSFKSLTVCPRPWRNQVRNVDLFLSEMPLVPHRYLVVATRVNPNAKKPATRALHVRAWNSAEKSQAIDGQAAVEIASAHLFGLFKNLGLWHNARAVAFAPWRRNSIDLRRWPIPSDNLNELAIKELEGNELGIQQVPGGRFFVISSEFGEIQVELSRPLLDLASTLREATELTTAMKALRKADGEIDDWTHSTEQLADHGRERILSYGARIHFPSRFPFKDE